MKDNVLEYKGYHTVVEYDVESKTLHGVVEGINGFVNFVCEKPAQVEKEFHKAVDDYLSFCEEVGKVPEKTVSGL